MMQVALGAMVLMLIAVTYMVLSCKNKKKMDESEEVPRRRPVRKAD